MGEQSMRECVVQQLEIIREHLPSHVALDEWVSEGAIHVDAGGAVEIARAWGYLEGVADSTDMTVLEMLDAADIKLHSFDCCGPLSLHHRAPVLHAGRARKTTKRRRNAG